MAKKPNLAAALAANKEEPATAAPIVETQTRQSTPQKRTSSRAGQTNISGWFDMPVKNTLDELRLRRQRELGRRVTVQELMAEAYNDLFKKYGLPEVAPTRANE